MTSVRRLLGRSVGVLQQGVLVVLPHGGQRTSRANAWAEVRDADSRRADRISAMRAVTLHPTSTERAYAVGGR